MRTYKLELYSEINQALEQGKNICIIHPYRTGSTSLGLNISKFFNIPYFDEINHKTHPGRMSYDADKYDHDFDIKTVFEKPCVYKINIGNIFNHNILNASFNIVVTRRIFNLQVASLLMAKQDYQFHSYEKNKLDSDGYDFSPETLKTMVNILKTLNEKCMEIKCDRRCYYEDLVNNHVLEPLEKIRKLKKDPAVIRKILYALKKLESE